MIIAPFVCRLRGVHHAVRLASIPGRLGASLKMNDNKRKSGRSRPEDIGFNHFNQSTTAALSRWSVEFPFSVEMSHCTDRRTKRTSKSSERIFYMIT